MATDDQEPFAELGSETPAVGVGVNDRRPNFRTNDGKLYLMRCFACEPEYGRENYCMCVADGVCAWCGWSGAESPNVGDQGAGTGSTDVQYEAKEQKKRE